MKEFSVFVTDFVHLNFIF